MFLKKYIFKIYQHIALERCDDDGTRFYFSSADFPNLYVEAYPFTATAGHRLQGWLYFYENYNPDRVIVFEHGMGGGHQPYMKEIEMLCRHGYRVFTYDHTGCMDSGGESANGFAQFLCDLNDCISAIKCDNQFKGIDISIVGHSCGGYSAMNIVALHPDISHIVAMCGFVSVKTLLDSHVGSYLKRYSEFLEDYERKLNPRFVDYNAIESLSKTNAKVLLIYSNDDKKCKSIHYDLLENGLNGKSNIRLLMVDHKGHNPTYTKDAVRELEAYAKKRRRRKKLKCLETQRQKAAFVSSFDWERMTKQDETVWAEIINALET